MFIAIAPKGQEFFYRTSTRLKVSKASANKIAKILTDAGYKLKAGEVWHPYDTEFGEDAMAGRASIRRDKTTGLEKVKVRVEALGW